MISVLPMNARRVDAAWIQWALRQQRPDVEVRDVRVREIQSSTATRLFIDVDYGSSGEGLSRHLVIKGGFDRDDYAKKAPTYRQEALTYRDVLPHVPVPRPDCYFAAVDDDNGQGVLILEDVVAAGGTAHRALQAPSVDVAAQYLNSLASLHGATWEAPLLRSLPWLKQALADDDVLSHWWTADQLKRYLTAERRGEVVDPRLHDPQRLLSMIAQLGRAAGRSPRAFLHGDTHIGNTYRDANGQAAFLDWQGATAGPAIRDVAYFMVSNLTTEDRRAHERDLLAHYLSELSRRGVEALSPEAAWTEYRRWTVLPLVVWIGNSDQHQPAEANRTGCQRCSTAIVDLDVLSLFD